MTEISPLRWRMIEDMTVRNLSPLTQQSYMMGLHKRQVATTSRAIFQKGRGGVAMAIPRSRIAP